MSDMSNLYRAYSAVHSSEVSDQLNESRDLISDMQFNQLNSSDLQEVAEEILEEMFELSLDIEQSSDIIADILSESLKTSQSDLKSQKIDYIGEAFDAALENGHTVERFLGYRRSKKVQENFHNTSNEDRSSKRLHEALIAQERKNIKEGILSLIEKKTKDSSYLETNMKKRQDNNEKARKDMEKMGTSMKNPQLEEFSQIRKDWSGAYSSIYEKMDPVGKEDGDIDNDGDKDFSDDYLAKRRKAIGKSMGKKGKCEKCGKDPCECDKKEVEEGYKELPKNKMFRKAGNLGRDAISTPIDPEKRQKAYDRSKKIVKTLNKANEEVQQVDEAITSEKGKAKMKSMIDARTTDSGRAKPGKGQNVKDIKHIGRANVDGYGGTPPNLKVAKNPVKSNFTGLNSGTGNKAAKRAAALKKEEVTFSESELEAIQAKVDAWDVEEGYQRNPEKGEAQARKSETSGQKTERNVRDRLKTMDPDKAEAMKKQMRAVGLSV